MHEQRAGLVVIKEATDNRDLYVRGIVCGHENQDENIIRLEV